jgi:lysophospholipase L1-like esterase
VHALVLAAALCGQAHAQVPGLPATAPANPCSPAPVTAVFGANTNRIGLVDLHFFQAHGAAVTYYECRGGRAQRLGVRSAPGERITSLKAATTWRCDRLTRRFVATAPRPDGSLARGSSSVRTSSCARRFRLDMPRRVALGRLAQVRIVDRWELGGIAVQLCAAPPGGRPGCRRVVLVAGARVATRRLRPAAPGRWRVELRVRGHRVRAVIAVGVGLRTPALAAPPTLLATGDSTMQGVESFLADDLGAAATVVADVRPGIAISRRDELLPVARSQVARVQPRTTVVSIGAIEGYRMTAADGRVHDCCDEAWVTEYTRRVRAIMRVYRRRGRARVFWLTIPAPRDPARIPITDAVNRAIVDAGDHVAGARVLRMDLLFTPDGYREVMRYRGRDVRVREADGIHLNVAGTAITARAVAQAIRGR